MSRELASRLQQSQGLWRQLKLEAHEGDLRVHYRHGLNEYRQRIPLHELDENTMSIWTYRRLWRVGALSTSAAGGILVMIWLLILGERAVAYRHSLGVAGASCLLCSAALAAIGRLRLRERILIFSRVDGSQLTVLYGDSPSAREVKAFLDPLLEEARRLSEETEEQAILSHERYNTASEIRKFHQLAVDGVIDAGEFARKKRALLEGFLRE